MEVDAAAAQVSDMVEVTVLDGGKEIARAKAVNGVPVEVAMPADMKLWSPDSPFLYDLKVALVSDGKEVDRVDSYTAMRKYSTARDADGIMRLQLNNKDIFHFGPLDQGWWPDGLYTAATDEALEYDVIKTKDFGFNMIRKHVKVEPARWYTFCDRHGIMVWQDMPSGDGGPQWQMKQYFDGAEWKRGAESEANYRKEWKEIMDYLYSNPCIAVWVPFNEAWGQFKTHEIAEWTKTYDPTRSVNSASGGNHYTSCGDILDLHNYPQPELYLYDTKRVTALGEYRVCRRRASVGARPQLGIRAVQEPGRGDRRLPQIYRYAEGYDKTRIFGRRLYADQRRRDRGERADDLRPEADQGGRGENQRAEQSDL